MRGSSCKPKSLNFPLLLDTNPSKKLSLPVPPLITDHILEKIAFWQILPKNLPVEYIFSYTVMTKLNKLIGTKSLNIKQCPIIITPLPFETFMGSPGDMGESQPAAKNLLIFSTRKTLLNKFISSAIKKVIPSPSYSSFHLITVYKLHLLL